MVGVALAFFFGVVVEGDVRDRGAAQAMAHRALAAKKNGDMALCRGYISLALHIDPFIPKLFPWIESIMKKEPRQTWRGNLFVGLDKTFLEDLLARSGLFIEDNVADKAIYTWRNLELTGLSCCGMDNMGVLLQQSNNHMYVVPFFHLVPWYPEQLKDANQKMYLSFKEWWENNGRRPMPEPQIVHHRDGRFEWDIMNIVFKKSRIPQGWNDLIQAALLARLKYVEEARNCALNAIQANGNLRSEIDVLLPQLMGTPYPVAAPHANQKFVVCYNPHVGLGNLAVVMVSAHVLARITGRTFVLNWNVNLASSRAFKLRDLPEVKLLKDAVFDVGVAPTKVKQIYFFHHMYSPDLGDNLELLGCSNLRETLDTHRVVTVSSNLFFAPILAKNPNLPGLDASFPKLLNDLLQPSDGAVKRALTFARDNSLGKSAPVVAIHIRAREEGEDNDDWPKASAPDSSMLEHLRNCTLNAILHELGDGTEWDLFIATTTQKATLAVKRIFEGHVKGLRRVLTLPSLNRNRRADDGAIDAMAEALLISRADVFMRLVVGTAGFSTFAYLSNALRAQNEWVKPLPILERSGPMPNYLVTSDCGPDRCFLAPSDVRMASIAWHGSKYVHRSCGDVSSEAERTTGMSFRRRRQDCLGLQLFDAANVTAFGTTSGQIISNTRPQKWNENSKLFFNGDFFKWILGKLFVRNDEL